MRVRARQPRGGSRVFRYHIALGSNLGDREATLRKGWAMLADFGTRMRLSRLYETRPMYVMDQPLYLNAVGEIACKAPPGDMLTELHRIEQSLGRDRSREIRMGARTLDLDILLCGDLVVDSPELTIPHPRITERMFVLVPLLELSRRLRDPRTGIRYAEALAALRSSGGPTQPEGVYLYPSR
jgi:2-amino-4-hydroxy-6-hydroxymethyldihydropteridine diphosphokinase